MTDKEIIKALKFHSDPLKSCVSGCVYGNQRYCGSEMAKDALALISRQKAEVERLENSLAISKKETKRYVENYKRQKKEMEEYRNIIERATEGIREVKAMLPRELAKERAAAVKKFAEMLKATAIGRVAWDDDDEAIEGFVAVDEIDNLVKEFTEETT